MRPGSPTPTCGTSNGARARVVAIGLFSGLVPGPFQVLTALNGNTAAASLSMRRCASRPLTAPGASGCCAIVPARCSPWTGCASSTASTSSTHPETGSRRQWPKASDPTLDLLDRLAALVPPPRLHRHRYFGVLVRTATDWKFPRRPRPSGRGRQPRFPMAADSRRWKAGLLPRRAAYGRRRELTLSANSRQLRLILSRARARLGTVSNNANRDRCVGACGNGPKSTPVRPCG